MPTIDQKPVPDLRVERVLWSTIINHAKWGDWWPVWVGIASAHASPLSAIHYASIRVEDDWREYASHALRMVPGALRDVYDVGLQTVDWRRLTRALLHYAQARERKPATEYEQLNDAFEAKLKESERYALAQSSTYD